MLTLKQWIAGLALVAFPCVKSADSAIVLGLLNDFEDGTTQGWTGGASPTNIPNGGPTGPGDNFLQIGNGGNLASFNSGGSFSGVIDPSVTAFQVDLMRPMTDPTSLDIRLVMIGPGTGDRWTSGSAEVVPNDGIWRTYTFSLLEADLTQVLGTSTYGDLSANVARVKFQHDPDPASASGASAPGTLGIDNIRAIPEPATPLLLLSGILAALRMRRR